MLQCHTKFYAIQLIRLQNRVKSRLSNISLDEAMIEAYTAEGWKGARYINKILDCEYVVLLIT